MPKYNSDRNERYNVCMNRISTSNCTLYILHPDRVCVKCIFHYSVSEKETIQQKGIKEYKISNKKVKELRMKKEPKILVNEKRRSASSSACKRHSVCLL